MTENLRGPHTSHDKLIALQRNASATQFSRLQILVSLPFFDCIAERQSSNVLSFT